MTNLSTTSTFLSLFLTLLLTSTVNSQQLTDFPSVPAAVSSYTNTLTSKGYTLNLTIDHAANAASVNLTLRPTTVLFFQKQDTSAKLIASLALAGAPTLAIDLPEKVLIYEDANGGVRVKTNTPGYLLDRHVTLDNTITYGRLCGISCQLGITNDKGLIFTKSANSVAESINKIREAVIGAGFRVPALYEYDVRGRMSKVLVFGNPSVGTQLMQNSQEVGIDLPQKFLVFEDAQRNVKIVHNDPRFIARRGGVAGLGMLLQNVGNALQNFANVGAT